MDAESYIAFVLAAIVLILIPGPNVALIVANSLAHGRGHGLLTVAGTSSAMVIQLALTMFGAAAALSILADWSEWLRWIGVAYLLALGVSAWRSRPVDLDAVRPEPRSKVYVRGFLVSLANPKTLLFYGAFLPQFVDGAAPVAPQLVLLSATFLAIAVVLDSAWALSAARLRPLLGRRSALGGRMTGGLMIGAALGLTLARRP